MSTDGPEVSPFSKLCGCLQHHIFSGNNMQLLRTQSVKRQLAYRELVERGLITLRKKYVCMVCLTYSKENFVSTHALMNVASVSCSPPKCC